MNIRCYPPQMSHTHLDCSLHGLGFVLVFFHYLFCSVHVYKTNLTTVFNHSIIKSD